MISTNVDRARPAAAPAEDGYVPHPPSGAERVLGSTSSLLNTTDRLLSLICMEKQIMVGGTRGLCIRRTCAKVDDLWKNYVNDGSFHTEMGTLISPKAVQQYGESGDLERLVERVKLDVRSLATSPFRKSDKGLEGPTLLTAYSPDAFSGVMESYVMKWTNWSEICGNALYKAFGNCFSDGFCGFLAPDATGHDLEKGVRQTVEADLEEIAPDDLEALRENFGAIPSAINPDMQLHGEQIMLSERISGENLFDFAKTKYADLSDGQKNKFFSRLGRLAMLDLMMGNHDRLLGVDFDDGKYTLDTREANLGNAMIVEAEAGPVVHAIDNAINTDLIHDDEKNRAYLAFLAELFSDEKAFETMVEKMCGSLTSATNDVMLNDYKNWKEISDQLKPFREDLNSEAAKAAILHGFKKMEHLLCHQLIPAWNGPAGESLKEKLSNIYPELTPAISERLQLFLAVRSNAGAFSINEAI